MPHTDHHFCWHGIISTDTEAAQAFYAAAIGWNANTVPMGDEDAILLAPADGVPRAHLSAPAEPGIPSHWDAFLRVDDVDALTEKATANGGALIVPPMDIPPGRFSVVASPSGAVMHLFKEADASSVDAPDGEGCIHWTELHSHEVDKDLAWLVATFGFTTEIMPMPEPMGDYHVLSTPKGMAGGVMKAQMEEAPSMWLSWVKVADVDATAERITAAGGTLVADAWDVPEVGRMTIAMDPTGGVFGIITPPSA